MRRPAGAHRARGRCPAGAAGGALAGRPVGRCGGARRSRPRRPTTRRRRSTGSSPRPTARWSPYGVSEGGTENSVLRVVRTADAHATSIDVIPNCRACSVAWEPDGSGFCYTRYPEGDEYHRAVHHHTLGADWRDDPVVWAEWPTAETWPAVTMSPDGRFVLVEAMVGWQRTDLHVLDRADGTWRTLIEGVEAINTGWAFADDARAPRHHHARRAVGTGGAGRPRRRRRRARRVGDRGARGRRRARRAAPRCPAGSTCRPRGWPSTGSTFVADDGTHAAGRRAGHVSRSPGSAADRASGAAVAKVSGVRPAAGGVAGRRATAPVVVHPVIDRGARARPRRDPGAVPVARRHVDPDVPRAPRRRRTRGPTRRRCSTGTAGSPSSRRPSCRR